LKALAADVRRRRVLPVLLAGIRLLAAAAIGEATYGMIAIDPGGSQTYKG